MASPSITKYSLCSLVLLVNVLVLIGAEKICSYESMLQFPWPELSMYNLDAIEPSMCPEVAQLFFNLKECHSEIITDRLSELNWQIAVNYTDELQKELDKKQKKLQPLSLNSYEVRNKIWNQCMFDLDPESIRILKLMSAGVLITDEKDYNRSGELDKDLASIYNFEEVCNKSDGKCYRVEPDLNEKIAQSRDFDELKWIYEEYRNVLTPKMKEKFLEKYSLMQKWAKKSGHKSVSASWAVEYEISLHEYREELGMILRETKPLFEKLHSFIRHRLGLFYGFDKVPQDGLIPAHLTGDLWNQRFQSIADILNPFETEPDITDALKKAFSDNVEAMVKNVTNFYYKIGFKKLPDSFWQKSMFKEPAPPQQADCHASAHDQGIDDFRLKICSKVDSDDYNTILHEMGHIFYYLYYQDQRELYRDGANPGFHEAIGDTIQYLGVGLPTLIRNGWLDKKYMESKKKTEETEISGLLLMGAEKLMFIPNGIVYDLWRIDYENGDIKDEMYNAHWWKLLNDYQGIGTPDGKPRGEEYLDILGKYHIAMGIPNYSRYTLARVYQYQFLEAICRDQFEAGVPLHKCDVTDNPRAVDKFREMLSMGSSKMWKEAMKVATGQKKLDVQPLLNYYKPLEEWLDKYIADNSLTVGWKKA